MVWLQYIYTHTFVCTPIKLHKKPIYLRTRKMLEETATLPTARTMDWPSQGTGEPLLLSAPYKHHGNVHYGVLNCVNANPYSLLSHRLARFIIINTNTARPHPWILSTRSNMAGPGQDPAKELGSKPAFLPSFVLSLPYAQVQLNFNYALSLPLPEEDELRKFAVFV